MKNIPNFRDAVVVKVLMVTVKEGEGTPEDVSRLVHYYLDFDGNILFKHDPAALSEKE